MIVTASQSALCSEPVEKPYVSFLGTGAADIGAPKVGGCDNCKYVRENGGRNRRRFFSLLVSPDLVIDYSTTGRAGLRESKIDPASINYVLITHSHGDHCNPASIVELAKERAKTAKGDLIFFGNAVAAKKMRDCLGSSEERIPITVNEIGPYQEFTAGRWTCKALPGNHDPAEDCLLHVLRSGDGSIFYATDTTWFPAGTFTALKSEKLDLAVVEGTFCDLDGPEYRTGHMTFAFDRLVKQYLFEQKIMKPGGKFALTHLSLHWCEPYDNVEPRLREEGIIVPYDGMRIELGDG